MRAPLATACRSAQATTAPSHTRVYPRRALRMNTITSTAARTGGGYVVSGEKWFVTVGDAADFLLVLANVGEAPTMFLVDKKGVLRYVDARQGLEEKIQKLLAEGGTAVPTATPAK